jgi:hypothetical protein
MRKSLLLSALLLATVLILPPACKAPAAPAQFEVTSFNISPPEITAGETASITTQVKNIGGSEGTYTAVLTVDGAQAETKNVTVTPGATETVTFSLVKDKAGTYQVAIGELRSSLTVKPKLVAKEVELKYDDGKADGFSSVGGGYLVDFMPPAIPFTIKKIRLFGSLRGFSQGSFELEIWDKDRRVLYKEVYPDTKFPLGGTAWVELEVPNIEVSDRFYVDIWRGPNLTGGIHLGVDESVKNEHSTVTVRPAGVTKEVESWKQEYFCPCWFNDKSRANWMIRVVGTVMVPEE